MRSGPGRSDVRRRIAWASVVLATLAADRTEGLLAGGSSTASALTSGFHLALLVGAVLTAIAIPVAAAVLRSADTPAAEPEPLVTEEPAFREAA